MLTDPAWIGNPNDTSGAVTKRYKLKVTNKPIDCQEAIDPQTPCGAGITLMDVKVPQVVVVPLIIGGGRPTNAMIVEHVRRIKSLMPVPEVEFVRHSGVIPMILPFPDPIPVGASEESLSSDAIFTALEEVQGGYPPGTTVLGIGYELASGWGFNRYNGAATSVTARAWWQTDIGKTRAGSDIYGRNTGSHEFGHLIGSGHAVYSDGSGGFKVACSTSEDANTEPYPYLDPTPTGVNPATRATRALLGPTAGNLAVWGLDTRFFDDTEALPATLAVMDPSATFSIMSYCRSNPNRPDGRQDRWVDKHYHEEFVGSLQKRGWGSGLPGAMSAGDAGAPGGSVRDVLVVSGSRRAGADGTAAVTLAPTYTYATSLPVGSAQSGDWTLELLDSEGAVLRSVPFAADTPIVDIDPASGAASVPQSERWRVSVADPPAYSSYRIRHRSQTVAVSGVSAAAPVVSVVAPVAAQAFTGGSVSVSWTASDADGDDLVYHVHYSADGGATYSTVGAGLTSTSLVLPRADLAGSSRAMFRVIASDGTRSATAQSPVFTVAENPPEVIVHSPDGGRVYGGPGTVVLDATGIDTEDGVLAGAALVWTSSLDGQIAATSTARIPTDDLSAGTHVLTVTATDSSNMGASRGVVGFGVEPRCQLPGVSSAVAMVSRSGQRVAMECSER